MFILRIVGVFGGIWKLETVQLCISAIIRVWCFMDCVLVTLNVIISSSVYYKIFSTFYLLIWITKISQKIQTIAQKGHSIAQKFTI